MKTFLVVVHTMFCIMLLLKPIQNSQKFDLENNSSSANLLNGKALFWNILNFVTKNTKLICYASTRCLCLEQCIITELKKFQGLKLYLSEDVSDVRFYRLEKVFSNRMTELYLQFFQSSLLTFSSFNKFLQGADPAIFL